MRIGNVLIKVTDVISCVGVAIIICIIAIPFAVLITLFLAFITGFMPPFEK